MSYYQIIRRALARRLAGKLPTCRQAASLISDSLERRLHFRERLWLKFHLWGCVWCVRYLEQLRLMKATLRRARSAQIPAPGSARQADSLSAEARARLKRALAREDR